jgi:hypothetical protein
MIHEDKKNESFILKHNTVIVSTSLFNPKPAPWTHPRRPSADAVMATRHRHHHHSFAALRGAVMATR